MNHFENVIGYNNIKQELEKVLDIMKNEKKYKKLGAKIPKNILLIGKPGLGKTLIANRFIKASNRNAYIIRRAKGTDDFIKEIKNTFDVAKKNTPSIILLDDIDKFAKGDERQTNCEEYIAIQTCIDNINDSDVFVLGTVNNESLLPASIIRSGRFDLKFKLEVLKGNESKKLIEYYLKQKRVDKNVDINLISKLFSGYTCADIETIINYSSVLAGFDNRKYINTDDVIKAFLKTKWEYEPKNNIEDIDEVKRVAYHEAGHVVLASLLIPNRFVCASIFCISGILSGQTHYFSQAIKKYYKDFYEKDAIITLGGKAAREIVFGEIDCGSNSDMLNAVRNIRYIYDDCVSFGFEKFESEAPHNTSPEYKKICEVTLSNELYRFYNISKKLLIDNRELLDKVANLLVQKEYITFRDVEELQQKCKTKTSTKNNYDIEGMKIAV